MIKVIIVSTDNTKKIIPSDVPKFSIACYINVRLASLRSYLTFLGLYELLSCRYRAMLT